MWRRSQTGISIAIDIFKLWQTPQGRAECLARRVSGKKARSDLCRSASGFFFQRRPEAANAVAAATSQSAPALNSMDRWQSTQGLPNLPALARGKTLCDQLSVAVVLSFFLLHFSSQRRWRQLFCCPFFRGVLSRFRVLRFFLFYGSISEKHQRPQNIRSVEEAISAPR